MPPVVPNPPWDSQPSAPPSITRQGNAAGAGAVVEGAGVEAMKAYKANVWKEGNISSSSPVVPNPPWDSQPLGSS